ncbi:MAG: hypothetical protein PHQ23_08265, partial [Candidatus Wallbacteria bacterium]|nr:hypothetical protein [Candidatus Wallbacteria bacterium]
MLRPYTGQTFGVLNSDEDDLIARDKILSQFHRNKNQASKQFAEFVYSGLSEDRKEKKFSCRSGYFGSKKFVQTAAK